MSSLGGHTATPSSQFRLDKCWGVCATLTLPTFLGRQMVARRTLGGLGGIVQTAPTFKDQAGRVGGPRQALERDPTARMLLSCINKQQQLLSAPPQQHHLHHHPLNFPPEDPCPVKFSLATTANKAQSLLGLNCEWHQQNAPATPSWLFDGVNITTADSGRGADWMFAYV